MSHSNRHGDRRGRRRAPRVEGLEPRPLLSVAAIYMKQAPRVNASALIAEAGAGAINAQQDSGSTGGGSSSGGSSSGNQPVTDPSLMTPHELARETFVAKLVGQYVIGPGRLTTQAAQIQILASGGSNQASHINLQMGIFTPKDTADGTTDAVAVLFPRNVAQTGTTLALDATAPPPTNTIGIPTQYTWNVDSNSGGIYLAAGDTADTNFGSGQGTITLDLIPGGKVPKGATGAGKAIVIIKGLINTGGIFSDLGTLGNRPKQP